MKFSALAATGVVALVAGSLNATPGVVYNDSASDIGSGIADAGGTANILSCEVSHTATDVQFSLTVGGNVPATDWAKFMIGISSPGSATKTTSGNGWGRPINFSNDGGMNYWVGSWVDWGGGAQAWSNSASGWAGPGPGASISFSGNNVTLTVSRAAIGMSGDGTFLFDVYTSGGGGGDGAIDALSTNSVSMANWGDSFTTTSALSYTIGAVPAPGAIALIGMAGLIARRRKA
jgi:hypothetical protein